MDEWGCGGSTETLTEAVVSPILGSSQRTETRRLDAGIVAHAPVTRSRTAAEEDRIGVWRQSNVFAILLRRLGADPRP